MSKTSQARKWFVVGIATSESGAHGDVLDFGAMSIYPDLQKFQTLNCQQHHQLEKILLL